MKKKRNGAFSNFAVVVVRASVIFELSNSTDTPPCTPTYYLYLSIYNILVLICRSEMLTSTAAAVAVKLAAAAGLLAALAADVVRGEGSCAAARKCCAGQDTDCAVTHDVNFIR